MLKPIPGTNDLIIFPIAGETLGVRGFCFLVKTQDLRIILDPGCALGPKSEFKVPHPFEFKLVKQFTYTIIDTSKLSDIIFISHFHHDHFKPNIEDNFYIYSNSVIFDELYANHQIIVKSKRKNINHNMKLRAEKFQNDFNQLNNRTGKMGNIFEVEDIPNKIIEFPNRKIQEDDRLIKVLQNIGPSGIKQITVIGETILIFPNEFFHGEDASKEGTHSRGSQIYIQPLVILCKENAFYFFPDVQGMPSNSDLKRLFDLKKQIESFHINYLRDIFKITKLTHIIAFGGLYIPLRSVNEQSIENSKKIISEFDITIMDHHIFRDMNWQKYWNSFKSDIGGIGKNNLLFSMNAEITDETSIMECNRRRLYEKYPPSQEFKNWAAAAEQNQTRNPPPER